MQEAREKTRHIGLLSIVVQSLNPYEREPKGL
jgi:hypothetical protein